MAKTTIVQGQSRTNKWNADTTGNTFDAIEIELTQNNKAAVKWRWPDTDGFEKLTKDGALYWFKLRKKKPDTKGPVDLDDYDYGDEDEDEEYENEDDADEPEETEDADA